MSDPDVEAQRQRMRDHQGHIVLEVAKYAATLWEQRTERLVRLQVANTKALGDRLVQLKQALRNAQEQAPTIAARIFSENKYWASEWPEDPETSAYTELSRGPLEVPFRLLVSDFDQTLEQFGYLLPADYPPPPGPMPRDLWTRLQQYEFLRIEMWNLDQARRSREARQARQDGEEALRRWREL